MSLLFNQAGGQVGEFIVEEILKIEKHKITAITREGSTNKIPDGVHVKKVNYDDQSSLVEALKGQDALIITMGVMAPPDQQSKLIEAAATAGVPWVLPNEYGNEGVNEQAGKDIFIGPAKKAARDQVEKLGKSSWIGIICGFWYEWSLGGSPDRYGFNLKNKTVTFWDEGTTRLNTSTWPQVGRTIANLLSLKVLPDDESDKSPCLVNYRNKFVYTSSFTVHQKEMFDSILRVTGTSANDWKATYAPVKEVYADGIKELQSGNRAGFVRAMYSRSFFPDGFGNFEASYGLDNDKLGLPKEDMDEFTKVAIQLHESGYFETKY